MIAKWFLFLKKSVERIKESIVYLFEDRSMSLRGNTLWMVGILALVGPLFLCCYFFFLTHEETILNQKMATLEKKVKSLVELRSQQEGFIRQFGSSDLQFLEHYVESVQLLKEEKELFSKIGKGSYEPIQARLSFLTGEENQIHFVEEKTRKSNLYIETEWKLEHPVEASPKDVLQIISLVEGVKMGPFIPNPLRPQIIIKKFSLVPLGHDYKMDLEVMQRSLHAKN